LIESRLETTYYISIIQGPNRI